MRYDRALLTLYVIALALIIVELFEFWGLAIILMLFLIITLLQKIGMEENLESQKEDRKKIIDIMTNKLDNFSKRIEDVRYNLNKHMFVLENKFVGMRSEYKIETEKNYRELARKIFEVENNLNRIKRTLGAAFGSLDERLKNIEERKEEEF